MMIRSISDRAKGSVARAAASLSQIAITTSDGVDIPRTRNRTMMARPRHHHHQSRTYRASGYVCSQHISASRSSKDKRFIKIVEVGPRDGLQNEKKVVPTENKIQFIQMLAEAGCPTVEAAAFVSPKWVPSMADGAAVMEGLAKWENQLRQTNSDDRRCPSTEFSVLVPNIKGFEAAMKSGAADEVAIFASASEAFSKKNINCSIDESIERFRDVMVSAKERDIPVRGYVSCVLGCPYQGEVPTESVAHLSEKLVEMGCREISLGDTIGVGTPGKTIQMIQDVEVSL
jgi:hydroxymethylglutaryl-CoA lyase